MKVAELRRLLDKLPGGLDVCVGEKIADEPTVKYALFNLNGTIDDLREAEADGYVRVVVLG